MISTTHTLFTLAFVLFTYRLAKTGPTLPGFGASAAVRAALQAAVLVPLLATRANWLFITAMIASIGVWDAGTGLIAVSGRGRPRKNDLLPETIGLFVRVAVVLSISGNPRFVPGFNDVARGLASWAQANSVIAASIAGKSLHDLLLTVSGVLLAGFDLNCVVALILAQSRLMPTDVRSDARAVEEAGRGRVIGVLERSIVFVLVVRGQFSAVGLILAAKAIARFKELDERDFAEYVLIGTLLSISLAIAAALFLRSL